MENKINKKGLEKIAQIISENIFIPSTKPKTTIFLCGGDITNEDMGRFRMAQILSKNPKYEILYPEDLFDDLLAGQNQHSLLTLENILAESVDVIIIFPESSGSFAELGAFSNNPKLAEKMICIQKNQYKNSKSFVNYGPIRLVKKTQTGRVIYINDNELNDIDLLEPFFSKIRRYISLICKSAPSNKSITNILETENFILPCIFLIENVNNIELYNLIKNATKQEQVLCEIATKSALGRLISKRFISRTVEGYKVSTLGLKYVADTFSRKDLDRARLEIMNAQMRSKAAINYDRMRGCAPLASN